MIFFLFFFAAHAFELNISGVGDIEIQAQIHLFGETTPINLQAKDNLWVGEVETHNANYVPLTLQNRISVK